MFIYKITEVEFACTYINIMTSESLQMTLLHKHLVYDP